MTNEDAARISASVGRGIAKLRIDAGLNQDDLARAARDCGLPWTRSAIAGFETGRRGLSLGEALLIPFVMLRAGIEVELADLLPTTAGTWMEVVPVDEKVPQGARMTGHVAQMVLRGEAVEKYKEGAFSTINLDVPFTRAQLRKQAVDTLLVRKLREFYWPTGTVRQVEEALRDAGGEAEGKAARKLDVPPPVVSVLAHSLWGHGLTAERERVLAMSEHEGASDSALRTQRGHITRKLVGQIERALRVTTTMREAVDGAR